MSSSEFEIFSSSPFACVLRDRNRRDCCGESNTKAAAFQKNLNEFVRDHFQNCISVSAADENSARVHSGVGKEQGNNRNGKFLSKTRSRINGNNRSNDGFSIRRSTQSLVLQIWGARQAQEMESSMEKQRQEAELLASSSSSVSLSSSSPSTTLSSSPKKENQINLPVESEDCPENCNLGASSLVQIWEARLNRSNSMNNNLNPVSTSNRSSSGFSNNGNVEEHARESEMGNYVDERYTTQPNHGDSFADWESEPPTLSPGRNSDDGESERVRIVDIIKKLTSSSDDNDHEPEPGTNLCESTSRKNRHLLVPDHPELRELKVLSQVTSCPKIRGMQLEHNRHRELESLIERRAVSRYSHRGRIQSMLRIKFLHRGLAIQDPQRKQSPVSPVKLSQGSSIMHLREKFSTGVDCRVSVRNKATTSRSHHMEMANNAVHLQNSSVTNQIGEDGHNQEATNTGRKSTTPTENLESQTSKDHRKESSCRTDVTQQGTITETTFLDPQGTSSETTFLGPQGTAKTTTFLNGRVRRSGIKQDQEANHRYDIYSSLQGNSESKASLDGKNENEMSDQKNCSDQQQFYLDLHKTAETEVSLNDWEENEQGKEEEETYEQENNAENYYDWISEISRPRSYWENRRQTWYQEMLNNSSENEEIRQLLERRRVSTFLASDFRETMDQLMTSRVQRQTQIEVYQEEEQEEINQERIRKLLLSYLQSRMHPIVSQGEAPAEEGDQAEQVEEQVVEEEEEEDEDEEDEEQEEEEGEEEEVPSPVSHHFREGSNYFDQTSSPQPLPAKVYYQESRQSSSYPNFLSIEAELIYDLRGQIEQLHREMSELRKTIQSCVDMQVKLQLSNQREVHPVQGVVNNPLAGASKKRSCCICYKMQVDSLFYRCGHMCTCLKCAHELQWSSGKCPICQAPIMDIVRALMDS